MAVLTVKSVESAKADLGKRREVPDGALPGFYLVVQPAGGKSWAVRYRVDGKPKKLTLGAYPRLPLIEAREAARTALRAVAEGRDPAGEKQAAKGEPSAADAMRFGAVAADYVERYAKPRNRSWRETEAFLTRTLDATDKWQDRDVRSIGRKEVLNALDAVIGRGASIHANRLFAALRRFFAWTVERGILEASPMAGLKPPSPEVSRDRVLTDPELVAAWKAAAQVGYPFGPVVQLLILTGQRRSEVLEAEWREFDLDTATWTIPRTRAKNDRAHVVPLAPGAVEILRQLPRIGQRPRLLFTTTGETAFSGVSKATDRLQAIAGSLLPDGVESTAWRLHDLRRTFASGCARLGVPVHVVEKALNHTSGTHSGIVGVYQRHEYGEERRRAMELWAAHCDGLISGSAKVVRMERRAS
ncbi:integrase arm-type DNA-binding domain-containing protein [Methylobacterium sp. E-041]|uniref:tyrosine-type recombinase/integrase n=1 Tax=Methylobacterium sp. E-041 TaxID=2836573 RepID=UPI001FB96E20|nr:site-specific integrase [Methylobacterium sp. E-041]MCJ2106787.1 integrase arm-type DNA-binding domain-containing protein [Methylobacterium sp. E-041]